MSSSSSHKSLSTATTTAVTAVIAALGTAAVSYWYHRRTLQSLQSTLDKKRLAERTGRIRAEVKLRSLLKQQQQQQQQQQQPLSVSVSSQQQPNDVPVQGGKNHTMTLSCIATVISPYTKRMGTPRQGSLVPSSRGILDFHIPMETLEGFQEYSHAWILFGFHANTDMPNHNLLSSSKTRKTKIRPPRGGGIKVGQLATRSPHRPNPIGLSLVQIVALDIPKRQLQIAALDLVHGTPVYDIKPYVPWDIPHGGISTIQVPTWVQEDNHVTLVNFTPTAQQALHDMVEQERLAPLYTLDNDGVNGAQQTLQQILAQDPRASHKRGSVTNQADATYKLVFGKTLVEFMVPSSGIVQIVQIQPMDFDESAYVDGIPLVSSSSTTTDQQ